MSEIKNVGQTWMVECNQLRPLPFKGLNDNKLWVFHHLSTAFQSKTGTLHVSKLFHHC